jgi:hypothetical protein
MTENLLEPGEILFTLLTLGAGAPLLLASPALIASYVPARRVMEWIRRWRCGRSSRRRLNAALAATE